MSDGLGNGWAPGYGARVYDCSGTQLLPHPGQSDLTMPAGNTSHVTDHCLPSSAGYTITVSQPANASANSSSSAAVALDTIRWELLTTSGAVAMEGGVGTVTTCGTCFAHHNFGNGTSTPQHNEC